MSLNLDSVNAKLQRAEQHMQSLQNEITAWMATEPYVTRPVVNADSTRYSIIAYLVGKEPPLQAWTLVVGDSLHNLRCALDHLVYAIAVHESGTDPPPDENKLMFPIAATLVKFNESAQRIRTLSAPVRDAIEAVQPYRRPHPKLPPPLAILRDLENIDKHRLLRLAFAGIGDAEIELGGVPNPYAGQPELTSNAGDIKDGTEVVAFVFNAPNPGMKFVKAKTDLMISLWHGKKDPSDHPWHERNECHTVLTLLTSEVRTVVNTVVAAVR
jgi:hypothetical protein